MRYWLTIFLLFVSTGFLSGQRLYAQQAPAQPPVPKYEPVPLDVNKPILVLGLVTEYTNKQTWEYTFQSTKGDGSAGTTYEDSNSNGSFFTSIEIEALNGKGSPSDYKFKGTDRQSNTTNRSSVSALYPAYYSSCDNNDDYTPVITMKNDPNFGPEIVALEADQKNNNTCQGLVPLAPVVDNPPVYRHTPAPGRFFPSAMRPIHCSKSTTYINSFSEESPRYVAVSTGTTTSEEHGELALFVGGDAGLEYFIAIDTVAEDIDLGQDEPRPLKVFTTKVGGGSVNGTEVRGFFKGQTFYRIGVNVNSKCYGYWLAILGVGPTARRQIP